MTAYDLLQRPVVLLDFETTGLNPAADRVIEVAAIRVTATGRRTLTAVLRPDPVPVLPAAIVEKTGITQAMVEAARDSAAAFVELQDMLGDDPVIVGHNVAFDVGFLHHELARFDLPPWQGDFICTRAPATFLGKGMPGRNARGNPYTSYRLEHVCQALGIVLEGAHRAENDLLATEQALLKLWPMALAQYRPILNAIVRPEWARGPEYTPPRAVVYLTA